MGISLQLYRTRIGYFLSTKFKVQKNKTPRIKMNIFWPKKVAVLIILLSIAISIEDESSSLIIQENQDSLKSIKLCDVTTNESSKPSCFNSLSWASSGLSINKLQKIINGNRRSNGYKLAVWNCGRGLFRMVFQSN